MANVKADERVSFHAGYGWKAIGLLVFIAAVTTALFLGPTLRKPEPTQPPIHLPAMSNPPPPGSLHIEPQAQP